MPLKLLNPSKNIGEILSENINNNSSFILFLDWDDTVINTNSLKHYKVEFRNQKEKDNIIDVFKKLYESKECIGLYILTYRKDPNEVFSEATELGIMEYLKSEFTCTRTDLYNRIGPIISVEYGIPKITILNEIINIDFGKISKEIKVHFIDDNYQNIVNTLLSNSYEDNITIYFYPQSSDDIAISKNVCKKAKEVLKYLK